MSYDRMSTIALFMLLIFGMLFQYRIIVVMSEQISKQCEMINEFNGRLKAIVDKD